MHLFVEMFGKSMLNKIRATLQQWKPLSINKNHQVTVAGCQFPKWKIPYEQEQKEQISELLWRKSDCGRGVASIWGEIKQWGAKAPLAARNAEQPPHKHC